MTDLDLLALVVEVAITVQVGTHDDLVDAVRRVEIDRHGFRNDQDYAVGTGGLRVLNLGDSTTFGVSVEPGANYSKQLAVLLQQWRPDQYEVINAGVAGYSTYQGLRYFQGKGLAFKPDLIIVSFGYNDSIAHRCSDSEIGKLKRKITAWNTLPSKILAFLRRKSAFVRNLNYFSLRFFL